MVDLEVRQIEGFSDRYYAREDGRIVSGLNGEITLLKGATTRYKNRKEESGYKIVCLYKDKKSHTRYVHRLIAKAFILNPNNYPIVNHKDGCKTNNHKDNLEWVTHSMNIKHAWDTGLLKNPMRDEEYRKTEVDIWIVTGETSFVSAHIKKYVTKEDLYRNHVPPELLGMTLTKGSYVRTWKHYVQLFKACQSEATTSTICEMTGVHKSVVSNVRESRRMVRAVKIYNLYKDNEYFLYYT